MNGHVVRWAGRYDLLVWLMTYGRERHFRERLIAPAKLRAGEAVLDVGCGTGTLAILAKAHVGAAGRVHGVDASPEMIARATMKARKKHADVAFEEALAQALPFPDATFDVVLSTVMLHHLRRAVRQDAMREMRRVLTPGGRLLAVDFCGATSTRRGPLAHFHPHGHVEPRVLEDLVRSAGFEITVSGAIGTWDLHYVIGTVVVTAEAPSLRSG